MKSILKKLRKMTFLEILEKIHNRFLRRTKFKNFFTIKSLRSESDSGLYSIAVQEALTNKKKFNNFKSNIFYQDILEHVNYPQGLEYLNIIKRDSNLLNNIDKFLINDQIGNPKKYYYEELKTKISPTTLRYIKVASDIKKIFKDEITNIVEIGCGYGGQYLILDQVMKINHYILMDLHDVNKLIEKYLEHHLLNSSYETKTINQLQSNKQFDLVISNYAFSELPPQTQISYIKKILLNSKNGYLTMNSGKENSNFKNHLSLEEIRNYIKNITILEEEPNTSEGNYIIIWGNIKI
jgi:putative sugar O-methyltransferase